MNFNDDSAIVSKFQEHYQFFEQLKRRSLSERDTSSRGNRFCPCCINMLDDDYLDKLYMDVINLFDCGNQTFIYTSINTISKSKYNTVYQIIMLTGKGIHIGEYLTDANCGQKAKNTSFISWNEISHISCGRDYYVFYRKNQKECLFPCTSLVGAGTELFKDEWLKIFEDIIKNKSVCAHNKKSTKSTSNFDWDAFENGENAKNSKNKITNQNATRAKTKTSLSKKKNNTKEEIESRYKELLDLLEETRDEIGSRNSKHKNISKLQDNMYMALDAEIESIAEEIDNAMNLVSWDNLVIAFFGETNAGKSTIIETFRILFEQNRKKGQDGLIVGDGRQDFTKDYHEYKLSIGDRPFTLIDVPGIEGNEADFRDVIKSALHKAHCVFYVQGHNKKPDSATAEKIKNYLGDWVNVYSIQNVRGAITNYDEEEERETLLTPPVLKNEKLIKESFENILGDVYKGNITLQALLAMCAKASFSNQREDLQRNQEKLLKYFGNADEVLRFSQFSTIRQLVEEKATSFTDEIAEANKQKMISLARRSATKMEEVLSGGEVDTSDIERKLIDFKRDVQQILGIAQTNIEQKVPGIIRSKLSQLKGDLYGYVGQGFETLKNNGHNRAYVVRSQINAEVEGIIRREINNASQKIDNKKKELPSVKLRSNINLNINVNIDIDIEDALEELDLNLDKIGNFALGTAGMAATGAAIGSFIPGIGTLVGAGVGALVGAVTSGASGDGGKAEAKRAIAESIADAEQKAISEVRLQINAVKRGLNNEKRKLSQEIDKEIDNIDALSDSTSFLKNDIRKFINKINNTAYGAV